VAVSTPAHVEAQQSFKDYAASLTSDSQEYAGHVRPLNHTELFFEESRSRATR
jgi:hypothetical protein